MRRQAFHLDLIARPSPNSSPCSRAAFSAITALLRGRRRLGDCEPHAGCAELGHRARDIDPAPSCGGDHSSADGLAEVSGFLGVGSSITDDHVPLLFATTVTDFPGQETFR